MNKELKKFEADLDRVIDKNNALFEWKGFIHLNNNCKKVEKIAFALDLSIRTINYAIKGGADVLLCFHSLDKFDLKKINHKKIKKLLNESNLSVYKCHLPINFSPVGIHYQACNMFNVNFNPEKFILDGKKIQGGVYRIKGTYSLGDIVSFLKILNPKSIKIFNEKLNKKYSNIFFSSGSGCKKEMLNQIKCDLFISGEIKHGSIVQAEDLGITLIEIGHYASEAEPLSRFSEYFSKVAGYKTFFIDSVPREKII